MSAQNAKEIGEMVSAAMDYFGQTVSESALAIWASGLAEFSVDELRGAFAAHIKDPERGRYAPRIADIVAQVPSGHPDPQEAYSAISVALADERVTLVMTDEMRTAFFAANEIGEDRIAARMTFLEVYKREVGRARTAGKRPRWTVSLGFDKEGQQAPIAEALRLGRIPAHYAIALLPHRSEEMLALSLGETPEQTRLIERTLKASE